MKVEAGKLNSLLRNIFNTSEEDIGCEKCMQLIDRFVDLHIADKDPEEALPLVQAHLEECTDCREEFEILLQVLKDYPS